MVLNVDIGHKQIHEDTGMKTSVLLNGKVSDFVAGKTGCTTPLTFGW